MSSKILLEPTIQSVGDASQQANPAKYMLADGSTDLSSIADKKIGHWDL